MPAHDDNVSPPAPIARVGLRHPESGESVADIPMLIDSGADATLLPRSAVATLGIAGTGNDISWWRSMARRAIRKPSGPISFS